MTDSLAKSERKSKRSVIVRVKFSKAGQLAALVFALGLASGFAQVPMITNKVDREKLELSITNKYGDVFTNLTVEKVLPDGLLLAHKAGSTKVKFEELPDPIRAKYQPMAREAAEREREAGLKSARLAHEAENAKRAAEARDARAKADREAGIGRPGSVSGTVFQVVEDGLLIRQDATSELCLLKNHPQQSVLVDGSHVSVQCWYTGPYRYKTVAGGGSTIPSYDVKYPRRSE